MTPSTIVDDLWNETLSCEHCVRIYFAANVESNDRVLLSTGIEPTDDAAYAPGSFVPRTPWQEGSGWLSQLSTNVQLPAKQVGLYGVDQKIVEELRHTCDHRDTESRRMALANVLDYCDRSIARIDGRLNVIGLSESRSIGPTVTRNMRLAGREKIGLHIDSWDGPSILDRDSRTQRICINIGKADRFFLFVNRPITLFNDRTSDNPTTAASGFLRAHPDYPVIALRVRSGEAYLAPTELIVHDGWCPEVGSMDRTFTIRADFGPVNHGNQ